MKDWERSVRFRDAPSVCNAKENPSLIRRSESLYPEIFSHKNNGYPALFSLVIEDSQFVAYSSRISAIDARACFCARQIPSLRLTWIGATYSLILLIPSSSVSTILFFPATTNTFCGPKNKHATLLPKPSIATSSPAVVIALHSSNRRRMRNFSFGFRAPQLHLQHSPP